MTVGEHLKEWLKENGYDGLCNETDCACSIDDLQPCDSGMMDCEPGYKTPCNCEDHGCDWHISAQKEGTPGK